MRLTKEILKDAKDASVILKTATPQQVDLALLAIAEALENEMNLDSIINANKIDMEKARSTLSQSMLDRLMLTADRIRSMARGIRQVAALPSPLGITLEEYVRPNGLKIKKVTVHVLNQIEHHHNHSESNILTTQ